MFLEGAFDNMHVGVVASPGSEIFQRAVREYLAVVDRCMVDMHAFWPEYALLVVAEKVLEDSAEVGDKATAARAAMAVGWPQRRRRCCTCACFAHSACERRSTAYGYAALCAAVTAASLCCATRRVP